ncbi:MAG: hypothetical protein M9921_07590 [Fimbriimonadaceae bacterium]|nr:hypothetical protein [Chthonomonadaceae bacterium]MCO5296703.1 hypothetical protein [Fimbriimonadaceae bacterium]
MKKTLLALVLLLASVSAFAQDGPKVEQDAAGTVTISASGDDVRKVLHQLFTQAKKNYVCDPYSSFVLHLSLTGVEFEEALQIVCKLASLEYEVQNGIYFVSRKKTPVQTKAAENVKAAQAVEKPKGKLPASVLDKIVNTRLDKTDLKLVFSAFAKQAGITIEVAPSVPAYKIDAYLVNTSLKYALDVVTEATALKYRFTENQTLEIYKPEPENHVKVVSGG